MKKDAIIGNASDRPSPCEKCLKIRVSFALGHDKVDAMKKEDRAEEFLKLLAANTRDLVRLIQSLVINPDTAEDIYQETTLVLWKKFDRFEPGTSFRAWARKTAVNQVLAWRKRAARDRLVFSEELIQSIADEMNKNDGESKEREKTLKRCLEKLSPRQRSLISDRYEAMLPVETIASRLEKTVGAVHRTLSRIRHALLECVKKQQDSH